MAEHDAANELSRPRRVLLGVAPTSVLKSGAALYGIV